MDGCTFHRRSMMNIQNVQQQKTRTDLAFPKQKTKRKKLLTFTGKLAHRFLQIMFRQEFRLGFKIGCYMSMLIMLIITTVESQIQSFCDALEHFVFYINLLISKSSSELEPAEQEQSSTLSIKRHKEKQRSRDRGDWSFSYKL